MKDIDKIKEKWTLPKKYLEYLSLNEEGEYFEGDDFVNEVFLYGRKELISMQDGYSYNPI